MGSEQVAEARWRHEEEGSKILQVQVPGFKKEELQVKVDAVRNYLVIAGGEGLADQGMKKHAKFRQTFVVPDDCTCDGIKAVLNAGVLYLMLPKATRHLGNQLYPVKGRTDRQETLILSVAAGVALLTIALTLLPCCLRSSNLHGQE
ncbi:uncharacterized protein LOC116248836 [Nymphaea colorata]|nr:uncharacterized protein LOC116248836 [Nymphaea colorata]